MTRAPNLRRKHRKLVDYVPGQLVAGCKVIGRADNAAHGNARWRVIADCDHEVTVEGIVLRAYAKRGSVLRCEACRPRRKKRRTAEGRQTDRNHHVVVGGYQRPRVPRPVCRVCWDIGDRRAPTGCAGCGRPKVPEDMSAARTAEIERRRFDRHAV